MGRCIVSHTLDAMDLFMQGDLYQAEIDDRPGSIYVRNTVVTVGMYTIYIYI